MPFEINRKLKNPNEIRSSSTQIGRPVSYIQGIDTIAASLYVLALEGTKGSGSGASLQESAMIELMPSILK